MENNELYHHGVKGMRWGVRRTPTQLGHKPAKKKSIQSILDNYRKSRKKRLAEVAKKEKQKKAETAEEKQANIEKKKQEILKSRSAKELYKNAHLFDDKELQTAYNRLNLENNIKNLAPKEVNKGEQFMENTAKRLGLASDMLTNGGKLYNNVASILNTFAGTELPKIGSKKDSKAEKKAAKEEKKAAKEEKKAAKEEKKAAKEETKTTNDKNSDSDDGPVSGTIIGEGTSKGSWRPKEGPIFDADFTETNTRSGKTFSLKSADDPITSFVEDNPHLISAAETFVAGLLPEPKR
jgi:hypothetical protein